ncbi:MAG: DCC1-like thiol-disulfide oxidoreductase family protein [Halobacteriales archaeon]
MVDTDGEGPTDFHAVLIYDGECPFCSTAAVALRRLDGVGAVSWYDDTAQRLLEAQFDDPPFSLVLVDAREQTVFVGGEAARELAERAGLPGLVGSLVGEHYEPVADAIQRTVGSNVPPDAVHAVLEFEPGVGELFDDLVDVARAAVPGD